MRKIFSYAIFGFVSFFGCVFLSSKETIAQATVSHIVISEIQTTGGTGHTEDEFVELYNPSSIAAALNGWKLTKKTSTGTESPLVATISGAIAAHGFFLITGSGYTGSITPDITYVTNSIADNNTVLLYDNTLSLIDKVGFGTATDKETTALANVSASHSVERKANSLSTVTSMTIGADVLAGNGEDTDNNAIDFIVRTVSPQNSQSAIEPQFDTPTPSFTPIPTDSPTPTVAQIPSLTPANSPTSTFTPTLTLSPSSTPTNTPYPTSTVTPTEELSPSVTPTSLATPTITPIRIPSTTPIRHDKYHPDDFFPRIRWKWEFHEIHMGKLHFHVPFCHFHIERWKM